MLRVLKLNWLFCVRHNEDSEHSPSLPPHPHPQKLILRAINSSKSAFLAVTFSAAFFDSYGVYDALVVQAGVLVKNVLAAFRSQRVARMEFALSARDARLSVTLHCEGGGLTKRYGCDTAEADILQAAVDRDAMPTTVVAEAGELNR